jgi:two-component sensor histidine kinase
MWGTPRRARMSETGKETALAAHAELGRCRIRGHDLQLGARPAHALTLAVHELATNAVKHGALSTDDGGVDVSWQVEPTRGGRHLRLEWREHGGPPVSPPQRRGFGTRLIERSLTADEGGAVAFRFEPGGLVCIIDAAVSA